MRSVFILLIAILAVGMAASGQPPDEAIERSIEKGAAYLAVETPKWRTEHKCASCHHQGNAVRALLATRSKGRLQSDAPLKDSLKWLDRPEKWSENHGDPMASDQALAELQFGVSLSRAQRSFSDQMQKPLARLAKMLAARQDANGSFKLTDSEGLPSPITSGPILLTGEARRIFALQGEQLRENARKANQWLRKVEPRNTFEASSLLLALDNESEDRQSRSRARALLLKSAHADGGFGPYANAPAEVFDTALAILALSRDESKEKNHEEIDRAQRKIVGWQQDDGSWEGTTRPSGGVSYAHRVATTAWAVEALLENAPQK